MAIHMGFDVGRQIHMSFGFGSRRTQLAGMAVCVSHLSVESHAQVNHTGFAVQQQTYPPWYDCLICVISTRDDADTATTPRWMCLSQ